MNESTEENNGLHGGSLTKKEIQGEIDENKVDVAVRFLNNIKVRHTKAEQKIKFLKEKDLSDIEIEHAFTKLEELQSTRPKDEENDVPWSFFDYFKSIVLGAGILSAANYAYKAHFLPYVAHEMKDDSRIESLGESVQVLKDDIKQNIYELTGTLKRIQELMEEQKDLLVNINNQYKNGSLDQQLSLEGVKAELSNVKSMMLSRRQFPVAPFSPQSATGIPAWQRASEESSDKNVEDENEEETNVKESDDVVNLQT